MFCIAFNFYRYGDIFPNLGHHRQPVAAGRFYSANRETLMSDIAQLFESCVKTTPFPNVRAIISPHAGYVYSGKVAASAFSAIDRNTPYKNIFVIGSSHVMAFEELMCTIPVIF